MKDLNFFEPYIEKKEFKISKPLLLYSIIGTICIGLILYSGLNQIKIIKLNSKVNALQAKAENPDIVEKVLYIQEKEEEMNLFKTEVENIKYMDSVIESREIVNEEFIRNITYSLPKNTYLTSITIYENAINLIGVSDDKWSIAEFGRAIEIIDDQNEVYISNISTKEDKYSFNLDITLVEEGVDGEDKTQEIQDQVSN